MVIVEDQTITGSIDVGTVEGSNGGSMPDLLGLTSGATVQIQGPKLDFATITKGSGGWSADDLNAIIQTIHQRNER